MPIQKRQQRKRKAKSSISPERAFLYGVGVLAIGGAVYFTGKQLLQKKEYSNDTNDTNVTIQVSESTPTAKRLASASDTFPLKTGSRGSRVLQLQQGLQKILGAKALEQYTKIDGIFGSGTARALKAAGLPASINEDTFNSIAGKDRFIPLPVQTPQNLGSKLYIYATGKNFDGVMTILQQLNSTADYSAANNAFVGSQIFSVSKSIVTYLLEEAFPYNQLAKDQLKAEFLRMGLKQNDAGKWSLLGFSGYNDLVTIIDTYVLAANGSRIPVNRNTILGEQTTIKNGMTGFRSIDGGNFSVPTGHVTYV